MMHKETRIMPQSSITSFSIADILDPVKFTGYSTHDAPSRKDLLAQQEHGKFGPIWKFMIIGRLEHSVGM